MKNITTTNSNITTAKPLTLNDLKEAFDLLEKHQKSTFLLDSYFRRLPCFGTYNIRKQSCTVCFMVTECQYIDVLWDLMAVTEVALLPKYLTHDSKLVRQVAGTRFIKLTEDKERV